MNPKDQIVAALRAQAELLANADILKPSWYLRGLADAIHCVDLPDDEARVLLAAGHKEAGIYHTHYSFGEHVGMAHLEPAFRPELLVKENS